MTKEEAYKLDSIVKTQEKELYDHMNKSINNMRELLETMRRNRADLCRLIYDLQEDS